MELEDDLNIIPVEGNFLEVYLICRFMLNPVRDLGFMSH